MIENLQQFAYDFLKFYSENKHKSELNEITEFLLSHALSARGYNNAGNSEVSGESFFVNEVLSRSQPSLCIDVGANIGSYSLAILKATNSKVIAFEPLPVAFDLLLGNTSCFSDRIKLENSGVGAKKEDLVINYNLNCTAHASFSREVDKVSYLNNILKISVPVVTLDEYFENNNIKNCDLIKIDVEGFEAEVFKGAAKVFNRIRPRFIQMEFNWHQLFRNTSLNYFAELLPGYETYQLLPNGWIKRDSKDPYSNIFLYSNFVFVRLG